MSINRRKYNRVLWEQERFDELYMETIEFMHYKLNYAKKLGLTDNEIQACIDMAFVRTIRAFKPELGEFTTLLGRYLFGEVGLHFRSKSTKIEQNTHSYDAYAERYDNVDTAQDYVESCGLYFRPESEVEEQVCTRETNQLLWNAINQLSPLERDTLVRYYIYDQNQPTIASLTGMSQVKVSRVLRGAMPKLKALLETTQGSEVIPDRVISRGVKTTKEVCYDCFEKSMSNQATMDRTGYSFGTVRKYRTMYNKELGKQPTRGRRHTKCS